MREGADCTLILSLSSSLSLFSSPLSPLLSTLRGFKIFFQGRGAPCDILAYLVYVFFGVIYHTAPKEGLAAGLVTDALWSIFRNALLSHHDYFPKATKMISGVFKSVSPVNNVEILSICL